MLIRKIFMVVALALGGIAGLSATAGSADELDDVTKLLFMAIEANDTKAAGALIEFGAQINAPGEDGFAPLHTATFYDRIEIVRLLIDAKADLNLKGDGELTPLHIAALEGRLEIARLLLDKGADANAKAGAGGLTPYAAAMIGGQFEIMNLIKLHGGQ